MSARIEAAYKPAELEKLVIHLATLYDQGLPCVDFHDNPISDPEYDEMVRTLKKVMPESEAFAKGKLSPSTHDPDGELVIHDPPMTSIAKADGKLAEKNSILSNWLLNCCNELKYGKFDGFDVPEGKFVQSYKHDGVAIRLYYEKGVLVRAGLRPRLGVKGISVIKNVQYVKGVLKKLPLPLTMAIGGELECLLDDFDKVQEERAAEGEDLRKNPRNHTFGGINQQKNPEETKKARLSFVGYNITGLDNYQKYFTNRIERAKWCNKTLGVPFVRVQPFNYDDLQKMEDNVKNLPYEVDGIVLDVNDIEDHEQLGHEGDDPTGDPRGSLAWKFAEEEAEATVAKLEWNASRTGRVCPVVIFDKGIKLAGTTVTRATCSNIGWLQRMGIGVNTKVTVIKAGKIIPKVIAVVSGKVSKVDYPRHCPSCNHNLDIVDGGDENKDLKCGNPKCIAKQVNSILHYLKLMECKGLGEAKVEQILSSGVVKSLADLYRLSVKDLVEIDFSAREAILALATIHKLKPIKDDDKLVMNIINAKHEKKKVPGWQFFAALGISGAGKSAGKALFQTFRTFEEIMDASVEDLLKVEGIGGTTAEAIRDYFDNHSAAVKDLLNFVELEVPKTGKLSGKNFVLSGSFELGKNYWQKKIQDLGGSIGSSVGSKTDYLVAGPGSGSKSEKAKELEVTIIDVEKLEQMLLS